MHSLLPKGIKLNNFPLNENKINGEKNLYIEWHRIWFYFAWKIKTNSVSSQTKIYETLFQFIFSIYFPQHAGGAQYMCWLKGLITQGHYLWEHMRINMFWNRLDVEPKVWHKWTYLWDINTLQTENKLVVPKGKEVGQE